MYLGAILLAIVGWGITFGIPYGNFWIKIGVTVLAVTSYAFFWRRPFIKFSWASIFWGIISALVLYGIFFLGDFLSTFIIPNAKNQVGNIYNLGEGNSKYIIFMLLFFITGPGEELFWRGFLQKGLAERYGSVQAFVMATFIYGAVHIFSFNIMLIGAAWVAGAFWGLMYFWRRDLLMLIVSHSLWSAFIFAVVPIR